jgi:hypothetical protein
VVDVGVALIFLAKVAFDELGSDEEKERVRSHTTYMAGLRSAGQQARRAYP